MGFQNESFSFFPLGALFCLILFCLVTVRIVELRYRYKTSTTKEKIISTLQSQLVKGDLEEEHYLRLKELLSK